MANSDSKTTLKPPKSAPDFSTEKRAMQNGAKYVAGVDEVGRGPLAGPVVVSAVILSPDNIPVGLNDSKKLTAARREILYLEILRTAHVSIVVAPPSIIDSMNIRGATLWAMRQAVIGLDVQPNHVLVDGRDIPPNLPCSAEFLIGGDGKSVSIAAASIVAKVARDAMCPIMDIDSPGYQFGAHKGYGTKIHMEALGELGPTAHHRASFAPVAKLLNTR